MKLKICLRRKKIPFYWQSINFDDCHFHPNETHIRLILAAFGIPCKFIFLNGHLTIYLPPLLKDKALYEIKAFYKEESEIKAGPGLHAYPHAWLSLPFMGMFLLWHIFYLYEPVVHKAGFENLTWIKLGSLDHVKVLLYHQWYRIITALTLHSDMAHLVANLFFGSFFLYLTARKIGYGLAVFCAAISSIAGNFTSIFLHRFPVSSIGASTFVFSIIGIFCLVNSEKSTNKIFINLATAIGLLALLGTQGNHVDFPAHIAGMGFGVLCGYVVGVLKIFCLPEWAQLILYNISVIIFILAWTISLQNIVRL